MKPLPARFRSTGLRRFSWTTQQVSKWTAARWCHVRVLRPCRFDRCMACKIKLNLRGVEAVCTSEGSGGFKSVRNSCPSSRLRVGEDFGVILDLKSLRVSCYFWSQYSTVKKSHLVSLKEEERWQSCVTARPKQVQGDAVIHSFRLLWEKSEPWTLSIRASHL